MFTALINQCHEYLNVGNVTKARESLDNAWKHAKESEEKRLAHNMGNLIQREIFSQSFPAGWENVDTATA